MQISYLQKTTLVDYPWKVACIVFTPGCNFRCPFCHNPECVLPDQIAQMQTNFVSENYFFERLNKKKWLLDWVSICWWEPTLQPDLFEFIQKIKKLWFLVKLDTNGRDAKIIKKLLENKLIDYVAVDAKYPIEILSEIVGIQIDQNFINNYMQVLDLLKNSNINYEYRTTVIKWYHTPEIIRKITDFLGNIKNYYLQNYQSAKTLDPNFDWQSFTEKELLELKKIAEQNISNVWIRE